MSSQVPAVFVSLAKRCNVAEQEFLVLLHAGVHTADEFFFRYNDASALNRFIETQLFENIGNYNEDESIQLSMRVHAELEAFKTSVEAGCMRRLWTTCGQMTKNELTSFSQPDNADSKKVSIAVVQDLFVQAEARGLILQSGRVTPSDYTMTKVISNFRVGGEFRHIAWEEYLSKDDEEQARAQNIRPKPGFTFVKTGSSLEGREENIELRRTEIAGIKGEGILVLEDMLSIRSYAFDIAKVCTKDTLEQYTMLYMNALREQPPPSYRVPTIDEIRLFDKMISEDIYRLVSKNRGTVQEGLEHFLGTEGRANKIWKMLEQVPENYPDRGIKRAIQQVAAFDPQTGKFLSTTPSPVQSPASASGVKRDSAGKTLCTWCSKPRDNHPGRNFALCPENPNKAKKELNVSAPQQSISKKKLGKGKGKNAGKDRVQVPAHMNDATVAKREAPSEGNLEGRRFCFDFHTEGKSCSRGSCNHSHFCPKLVGGRVCMEDHPLYKHRG